MMLMVSDLLKVGLVTGHVPVSSLSSMITRELIVDKLKILSRSLLVDFGIRNPTIAVLGLNPHAGDNGLLGSEEQDVIAPAIQQARELGITAFGPFAADGFFGAGRFKRFDAVLAMYHDQGLAPFKSLSMENGVNFTFLWSEPVRPTELPMSWRERTKHLPTRSGMLSTWLLMWSATGNYITRSLLIRLYQARPGTQARMNHPRTWKRLSDPGTH